MELKGNYNRFISYGLILIGLAGFIFAIGDALIPQEGDMFNAAGDPEGFAGLVTTDNYRFWALRGLIGVPLEVIGIIALFLGLAGTSKENGPFEECCYALSGICLESVYSCLPTMSSLKQVC